MMLATSNPTPGVDGPVRALVAGPDGLIVAGDFANASGIPVGHIARWDGAAWHALGAGLDGPVFALIVHGDSVYAGGDFDAAGGTPATNVAVWDGTAWSAVGDGVTGTPAVVKVLAFDATGLLVGGVFTSVGASIPANGLARWNGTAWDVLGGIVPGIDHDIRTICPLAGTIYVGGVLNFSGSTRPSEATLARATSFVLSDYAGSANADDECTGCASVDAVVTDGVNLFVAGAFTRLGLITIVGSPYAVVELANATTPAGLGDGTMLPSIANGGAIRALCISGGALIAGGNVLQIRGAPASYIARWSGGAWTALGAGVSAPVRAIASWNGATYAGGDFLTAGGIDVGHVARWDGATWSSLTGVATPAKTRSWGSVKALFR
jgi:hypothetical protein